ncbi:TonB-dependent receptor plug domain-containing protein [Termitidicoccus mucosus]|uniref:TonB-dependent receptor plug domain-containing protein n=1 Tax=Termitidicoccus mucosus TaxID=1184151 RepID=A0A178ICY2_9BACT|nr:hypothetical protein AW736_25285 [Opitutaceae bacterium TSB47]
MHPRSFLSLRALGVLACAFVAAPAAVSQSVPADTAPVASDGVVKLPVFDVTTSGDVGYLSRNAESATRLNVPLSDIPQNVVVFNAEFLEDIMAQDITDVALYDPSINAYNENDNFTMRGFGGTAATAAGGNYFNGFPQATALGSQTLVNTGRIEVLKGPNAVLYGSGAFGGTINRISKKPLPHEYNRLDFLVDSEGYLTAKADSSAPLPGRRLGYRLNMLWADGDDVRNNPKSAFVVAPTISWEITDNTLLIVEYTHQREERVGNWEFPIANGDPLHLRVNDGTVRDVDIRRFLGESDDNRKVTRNIVYADLRHEFSRNLIFRAMFNMESKDQLTDETLVDGTQLVITDTTAYVPRAYRENDQWDDGWRLRTEMVAKFNTWGLKHQLLGGFGWEKQKTRRHRLQTAANNGPDFLPDRYQPADIFDHVPGPITNLPPMTVTLDDFTDTKTPSLYVSDLASVLDERLFFQAGFRYVETERELANYRTGARSSGSEGSTTHSLGFVYHLTADKQWSVYANNNTTYVPNFTVNPDGSQLDSMTGDQYEGGLKFSHGDRFNVLLCYFDIRQSNVPAPDPNRDDYQTTIDGLHSKGLEVNFNWNPSGEWSVFGGYAYTHSINTQTGERHYRSPLHAVSMFGRYSIRRGVLKGLSFNAGAIWRSYTLPQMATTRPEPIWDVPEYIRFDAGIGYKFNVGGMSWQVTAKVKNIDDRINYLATYNVRVQVDDPRVWILGLNTEF